MNYPTRTPNSTGPWPGSWFWLLAAPTAVIACLLGWRNVFAVFAIYHLGFCLLLPAAGNFLKHRYSFRDHLEFLALTGPGTARGLLLGLGLGTLLATTTILVFHQLGESFLATHNIPEVLAAWGVAPSSLPLLFWFMVLVNAPAEELFWRGFVHTGLAGRRPRLAAIGLTAACYASYHGVTVYLLVADLPVALLFLTVILAAGIGWGYLREKTGSVWPALLGHAGAVIGYMAVAKPLMGM